MTKKIHYKTLKKTKKKKNFSQTGGSNFDLKLLTNIYPSTTFQRESYQEVGITKNLSNFDKIPNSNVCLIKIHGSYFDSPDTLYFPVPDNVIICNLTEISAFSIKHAHQFDITRQPPEFFKGLFKNKATLSDYKLFGDDKFNFKNIYIQKKNYRSTIIHDLFYNSSWYYPGQLCHNVGLSCDETEIKRLNLVITDVEFESDDSDYKRPSFTKNTCNIKEKTMGGKDFNTNLQNICETLKVNGRKNIVILSNCMPLDINILKRNNLTLEQIRQYDNELANLNRGIKYDNNDLRIPSSFPDYYMINKSIAIFDLSKQQNFVDTYVLDKDNSIKEYHKIYRVLEIIKEKLGKGPQLVKLENKYIELLQNLSVKRLHDALKIIIPGFTETDPKYKNLISQILTGEYLEGCYNTYMGILTYMIIKGLIEPSSLIYKYMLAQIHDFFELDLLTNLNDKQRESFTYIEKSLLPNKEKSVIFFNPSLMPATQITDSHSIRTCIIQGSNFESESGIQSSDYDLSGIEHLKICNNNSLTRSFLRKFPIISFKKDYQVTILNSRIDNDITLVEFRRMKALFLDNCSFINNQKIKIANLLNRFILITKIEIFHTNIINLDLTELKIKSIKIKDCSELTQIDLDIDIVDSLEHLELVNLPKLGNLNGIIGLINKKKLLSLHISNFQITSKDIQALNQVPVKKLSMSHIVLNGEWDFNNNHIETLILDDFTGSNPIDFSQVNLSFQLNLLQLSNLEYTINKSEDPDLMELSEWYRQGNVLLENTNYDFNQFVDEDDFGASRG